MIPNLGPVNSQNQPLISPKGKIPNQMGGPGPGLQMNQIKNQSTMMGQMDPNIKMNQGGGMMPPHMNQGQQIYNYQQQGQVQHQQPMPQNNYGPNSGYMGGHMGSNMYGGSSGPGGGPMIPSQQG